MSFDEHPQPAPEGAPGLGALRREFDERSTSFHAVAGCSPEAPFPQRASWTSRMATGSRSSEEPRIVFAFPLNVKRHA
jgi:hypothetical protein